MFYDVGDGDGAQPADDLGKAIEAIEGGGTAAISDPVTIDINADQQSDGTWVMGKSAETPFYEDGLTINGGGHIVSRANDAVNGRLLVIANSPTVKISDIVFSGGYLETVIGTSPQTSGGGGLFIGGDDDALGQTASTFNVNDLSMTNVISAGWRHEWGDRDFDSRASYRNVPDSAWKLASVEADRDSADLGVGFELLKDLEEGRQLGLNVSFDANISGKSESNNIYAGVVFNF